MHRSPLRLLAALVAMAAAASPARAQSASAAAEVSVVAPISGSGQRNLDFGSLTPGTTRTVLHSDAVSAWWMLQGIPWFRTVRISFTLPSELVSETGASMPISFDGPFASACARRNAGTMCSDPSRLRTWNPLTQSPYAYATNYIFFPQGIVDVRLGGEVSVAPTQAAGTYRATVVMLVVIS